MQPKHILFLCYYIVDLKLLLCENSSYLNYLQLQNLENWLENPRIISAPGLTEYKQKCFFF